MKMKTAPVVMLDEMTIGRIRTLVRFYHGGRMYSAMKAADFVSRLAQVLGNELVEPRQGFGFFATVELFDVALFDRNPDRLLERTRYADMPRPYHTDLIDGADAFGISRPDRRPDTFRKRTIDADVAIVGIVVHLLRFDHDSFHV